MSYPFHTYKHQKSGGEVERKDKGVGTIGKGNKKVSGRPK
jgi:hypothetical protein